jgi:hypothetical protein
VLQVLDHEVFTSELSEVAEVVNALMRLEVNVVKHLHEPVFLSPDDVPLTVTA